MDDAGLAHPSWQITDIRNFVPAKALKQTGLPAEWLIAIFLSILGQGLEIQFEIGVYSHLRAIKINLIRADSRDEAQASRNTPSQVLTEENSKTRLREDDNTRTAAKQPSFAVCLRTSGSVQ